MYYTRVHAVCMYLQKSYSRNTTEPTTLQHDATQHCNMLQHNGNTTEPTAPNILTALQHTAAHYNTLQHNATQCNTLQHTPTHSNTLQHNRTQHPDPARAGPIYRKESEWFLRLGLCHMSKAKLRCNSLQHTATHCTTPRSEWLLTQGICHMSEAKLR